MNAIFALITILAIVLAVLVLLFFKSKKENNTQISQTPTPKKELKQKEIKAGIIDLFELLKLQSEILFEECARFDNTIFVNFSKSLPRIYDNSVSGVLQTVNHICKFFAFEFQKTTISINFSSLRISENKILLHISINSDKFLSQSRILSIKNFLDNKQNFDDINLIKAKESAEKIGAFLHFEADNNKIAIDFSSNLVFYKSNRFGFIKNKYDYNILICENNANIFDDLTLLFAQMGCAVAPNSTWANIKKHLDDFIYKPDIVFISAEILRNQKDVEYLNNIQKHKKAFFVFILRNKSDFKFMKRINFNAFKLKMPYLYDDIYALCEIISRAKQSGNLNDFD